MTWELILSKGLSSALVLLFFALIIILLRFLYGPRGRFREAAWDRWNEEARLEQEQKADAESYSALRAAFTSYARSWFTGDAEADLPFELKLEHSFLVCAHADELAATEPLLASPHLRRALKIAALFHDVARFEQYARYKTFNDALSCDHGRMGARTLLRQAFLQKEDRAVRRLVLGAVALHNRPVLPQGLPEDLRLVLLALRDADKLDILRVLEGHLRPGAKADSVVLLHLRDEPGAFSPVILSALEEGRTALYRDMRFHNDFRILLCSWLFDLHFPATLRAVKRSGHMERIIAGLDRLPEVQEKARAAVREALEKL